MTISRPATATQMRVRVSPAMHFKVFFMPDALPATTLLICGFEDQLRTCWLAYLWLGIAS